MIDNLFLLAVMALGLGLSLASYRIFARANNWPMGALQADLPFIPVGLGLLALLSALAFATVRGSEEGGWVILAFGVVLAIVWTGLLRVGAQIALFLAPVVTFLLLLGWLGGLFGLGERRWATERPVETLERRGIIAPPAESPPPAQP